MKLYFPKDHYDKSYRGLVFPLLKPFIKGENFSDSQRMALYGVSEKDFVFMDILEEADFAILTMSWNYYQKTNRTEKAIDFIKTCDGMQKKVINFNAGDFGLRIPYFKNLIILRTGGYKSQFSENEYSLPAFIEDPLQKYFNADKLVNRSYQAKPVIGFCGQANPSILNACREVTTTMLRNLKFHLGLSPMEPQQILSTSYLRAVVLKKLQQSPQLNTNFILRKQYRAGVKIEKDTHSTTLEFYENLKNSDYVVCVRGAGNFSVRFYETLAMGRIPIFINTDCALPFDGIMDWKKHVVWVEYKNRNQVAQKVKEFHAALSKGDFIDLQLANRVLWKEKLTLDGYFKNFLNEKATIN